MHGIHPCKDGTLRGNLVFQKLDVVATILQIQCPSAGRRPSQRLFFLCDSPCNQLQNLPSTSRYIARPTGYMPRPANLPAFRTASNAWWPLFAPLGRSTQAGSTQKAALSTSSRFGFTPGQGRQPSWVHFLNSRVTVGMARKTLVGIWLPAAPRPSLIRRASIPYWRSIYGQTAVLTARAVQ